MAPADTLRAADWDALLPRLTLWAGSLHARYLADRRGAPEPADLVHDAIADVGTGVRRLPPGVPLPVVLYNVIRSQVSAHLKGPRRAELDADRPAALALPDDPAAASDLRRGVLDAVRGDDLLEGMARLWFEDPALRPADLARLLGVDARAIYNARKRLDRRLLRFRDLRSVERSPHPGRSSAMRLLPALAACLLFALVPEAALAQAPPSAGLQAWYRADQGVFSDVGCTAPAVDAAPVQCWEDQSGNGLTLTSRNGSLPTFEGNAVNGEPAIDFAGTGANQGLVSATTSLLNMTEATIYTVTTTKSSGAEVVLSISLPNTQSEEFLIANRAAYNHKSGNNFAGRLGTCNVEGFHMQGSVFGQAPSAIENYINGVQNTQPLVVVGSPQPFAAVNRWLLVGARGSNISGEVATSRMAEILVYDRQLTEPERLQVEAYLTAKYDFPPVAGDAPFPSTNLALWLRGDGCLQTDAGGNVETWFDESGLGNDLTQTTAARRPALASNAIGGLPAAQFDGTDDFLTRADALGIADGAGRTYFVVSRLDETALRHVLFGQGTVGSTGNAAQFFTLEANTFQTGGDRFGVLVVNDGYDSATPTSSADLLHTLSAADMSSKTAAAASLVYRINADDQTLTSNSNSPVDPAFAPNSTNIGVEDPANPLVPWQGAVAEVIVFDGVLTAGDRFDVESYLCTKYTLACPALPVELTGFRARLDGATARLTWETGSETNNAGFAVEHRVPEETEFAEAGFVPGAGTTDTPQAYTFALHDLMPGTHAFRLRQTDFDGAASYSGEVEVAVSLQGALALGAFPNPAASGTTVVTLALAQSGPATVALFDALGRRVATLHEGEVPEGAVLRLAVPELPAGTYLVRASTPGAALTRTITVVR